ncbi:hypothetical protein [Bradyrhizobium sp. 930_D9_N1_4]|uniref:hypothetical protein n=1 Tax=Bradyrhizobium sp. 930_D9_N1_4 TaxID=3240374 RepID=UPI003F8C49A1
MKLNVELWSFVSSAKLKGNFLLQDVTVTVTGFVNGQATTLLTSRTISNTLQLPPGVTGPIAIDVLVMTPVRSGSGPQAFPCLHVRQNMMILGPAEFRPATWERTDLSALPGAPSAHAPIPGLHPLITYNGFSNTVLIDCTMLDVTRYWLAARSNSAYYKTLHRYQDKRVTLRILASIVETPMIWYLLCPKSLQREDTVMPHVFFSPADYSEIQPYQGNERYFFDADWASGKKSLKLQLMPGPGRWMTDGEILTDYLASPAPEDSIDAAIRAAPIDAKNGREMTEAEQMRNVDAIVLDDTTGEFELNNFNGSAGFGKALAEGSRRQLLMMPQRTYGVGSGLATGRELPRLYSSAISLLESCSDTFGEDRRTRVNVGKLVLSCYSDAGVSMWSACAVTEILDRLKGVICIEPMPGNQGTAAQRKARDEAWTELQGRKIQIHYVGRWKHGQFVLPPGKQVTRVYPSDPAYSAVYALPPRLDANPFITFRIRRFLFPEEDAGLKRGSNGVSAERRLLDRVLKSVGNDSSKLLGALYAGLNDTRYGHRLSLSGGEEMQLGPAPFYGKTPTYKTFFHQAIEAVDQP